MENGNGFSILTAVATDEEVASFLSPQADNVNNAVSTKTNILMLM